MSSVLYDAPGPRARLRNRVYTALGILLVLVVLGAVVWRLDFAGQLARSKWDPFIYQDIQTALLRAWWATVRVALVAVALSLALGTVLAVLRLSTVRALRWITTGLVEFLRAPPVLLMMFWFLYASRGAIPVFWCAVLGLTLYNGAIISEILRAGVLAVPKGQREAAFALGLTSGQVMRMVLLPQAVRSMLPSIVAQVVVVLKDSALAYIIGYTELLRWGTNLGTEFFNLVPASIVIAVVYIGTNMVIAGLAKLLERRLSTTAPRARAAAAPRTPAQVGGGAL
ncbi:amino acid ABC transporter permease [Kineococcus indalonis]|uniref:amino acid ABC transporter permease n=1 Tax=Kineococcus indalonis TaxID=2696566 RepID=UPI001412BEB3|nr:amino acid ABC transporter permease [Kineococcus indalonis]NAZ85071.1 ABC transporter permease subunit [Kineococcus indalonis]